MPRGRPQTLPADLEEQVMAALERRMDPATRMVKPNWLEPSRELHVSRSTISRVIASLRHSGAFESIIVPVRPGAKVSRVLYRMA